MHGLDLTLMEWGNMFYTVDRRQPRNQCCLVFYKDQWSVHCFSFCTLPQFSGSPMSWTFPSMVAPTIYKSTIIVSSVTNCSSITDSTMVAYESPQIYCVEDRLHLAGLDSSSSCYKFLRPDCCQWRGHPATLTDRDLGVIVDPAIGYV